MIRANDRPEAERWPAELVPMYSSTECVTSGSPLRARCFRGVSPSATDLTLREVHRERERRAPVRSGTGTDSCSVGIECPIGGSVFIRTVWSSEQGNDPPRFVTAYPLSRRSPFRPPPFVDPAERDEDPRSGVGSDARQTRELPQTEPTSESTKSRIRQLRRL